MQRDSSLRRYFQIESMERRLFLDATAALNSKGVFVVTGTDADETIAIALSSDGTQVQATLGGAVLGSATLADVESISVNAGAGADTVTVDAAITNRTIVRGGDGNDTLTDASGKAALSGGSGDHTINLNGAIPTSSSGDTTTTSRLKARTRSVGGGGVGGCVGGARAGSGSAD